MPAQVSPEPIATAVVNTKLGPVRVDWSPLGLREIQLGQTAPVSDTRPRELDAFVEQLKDYFAGKKVRFNVKLDLEQLPPFHEKVLKACADIPYGKTKSYGDLAFEVGNPKAARAVGQAMRNNPIPLVIPCHRVLASGGGLGGFAGGTDGGLNWKRYLLELESQG